MTMPGIVLSCGALRARVVDNSERLMPVADWRADGMNGLASLIHEGQNKNLFASVGMNLEECRTDPPAGAAVDLPHPPRRAPMLLERVDECSARLTQSAAEGAGLNFDIVFSLGEQWVDQTITVWPDHDIGSSSHFYASYMNQVQNTSLFMRARLDGDAEPRWWEATSPGHGGDGSVFYRAVDPEGKEWHEFLIDNPVRRQKRFRDDEVVAAAEAAGFRRGQLAQLGGFFFGFMDDYVVLYVFREDAFSTWMSSSGGVAVRCPAWDYEVSTGAQSAGERRSYHVRLVYKPFGGIDDVLAEVARFRGTESGR